MGKYIKKIFLFLLFLFIVTSPVKVLAATTDDECPAIEARELYEKYELAYKSYLNSSCDSSVGSIIKKETANFAKSTCLTSSLELIGYVTDMLAMSNEHEQCKKVFSNVRSLDCTGNEVINDLKNTFLNLVFIIAPFLLIIFVSFDLYKILTMSGGGDTKKAKSNIFKRVIAFLLLYLTPAIVNIFVTNFESLYPLRGNIINCDPNNVSFLSSNFWGTKIISALGNGYAYKSPVIVENGIFSTIASTTSSFYGRGDILVTAKETMEKYKNEGWKYTYGSGIIASDIAKSTNNPSKVTCCATFVASVLYSSGVLPAEFINKYGYNYANTSTGIEGMLADAGWKRVDNYDDMLPGDVAFTINTKNGKVGHTQIYAGENQWYNAGSDKTLYGISTWDCRSVFDHAMRYPGAGTTNKNTGNSTSTSN